MLKRVFGAALALCVLSSAAFGAGITFGENGTKALSLGGAFAGQADDLSAIQHNPAGLAQQRGFGFLLNLNVLNQDVTFLRSQNNVEAAKNTGGLFLLPTAGLSYGLTLLERNLTLAVGVYGPPAVGRYQYNTPNYNKVDPGDGRPPQYEQNPRKYAPQRYALVGSDTIILFPGISAAYQVHRTVSVGLSLQYVYANLHFAQSITTSDAIGVISENPDLDAQVAVDMTGKPMLTGILGVLVTPNDMMGFGLSVRPPTKVNASGTMKITLGELASSTAKVEGDKADLELTLPLEMKLGSHFALLDRKLGVNVDLVYEGWQSFSELVITPKDITQTVGNGEPKPLGQIRIQKRFHHTLGARAGLSYALPYGLEARVGALFEQGAADPAYFNLDFPHLQRVIGTVGLGYTIGPATIDAAFAYTPGQTLTVTDSQVRQVTSDAAVQGLVVGNGDYTVSGWIASVGVRGRIE